MKFGVGFTIFKRIYLGTVLARVAKQKDVSSQADVFLFSFWNSSKRTILIIKADFFQIEKCIKNSPFPQNLSFSKKKKKTKRKKIQPVTLFLLARLERAAADSERIAICKEFQPALLKNSTRPVSRGQEAGRLRGESGLASCPARPDALRPAQRTSGPGPGGLRCPGGSIPASPRPRPSPPPERRWLCQTEIRLPARGVLARHGSGTPWNLPGAGGSWRVAAARGAGAAGMSPSETSQRRGSGRTGCGEPRRERPCPLALLHRERRRCRFWQPRRGLAARPLPARAGLGVPGGAGGRRRGPEHPRGDGCARARVSRLLVTEPFWSAGEMSVVTELRPPRKGPFTVRGGEVKTKKKPTNQQNQPYCWSQNILSIPPARFLFLSSFRPLPPGPSLSVPTPLLFLFLPSVIRKWLCPRGDSFLMPFYTLCFMFRTFLH